jgi:CDP-4-dehydro-6-deoxyglucose reductase, E3
VLYWGGRKQADLYQMAMAQRWAADHENFSFIPVLSDSPEAEQWQGRTGFVHRAVMADFSDLSGYQVYACGAPVMVDSARKDFQEQCKLPEEEFFSDSFTPAAGPPSA